MKIKIIKFREDLIEPKRSHHNDAGLDCYAQEDFVLPPMARREIDVEGKPIFSNQSITVGLGFGLEIPDGYEVTLRPRSSMNQKGIITQFGTIDSGYRGEIKAVFCNLTNGAYIFTKGEKICQLVMNPIVIPEVVEDFNEEARGEGGFGSTDVVKQEDTTVAPAESHEEEVVNNEN